MIKLTHCIFILAALLHMPADAKDLLISPVNLDIQPGQKVAELRLTNVANETVAVQIRIQPWKDGDSNLRDIVASPSMVRIAANTEQLIRLVNVGEPSSRDYERMYRVLIDTLTPPQSLALAADQEAGIQLNFRYALPLFVGGPALSAARNKNTEYLRQHWQSNRARS